MQSGGFTETIWHFAGYLHIADAVARTPVLYSGDDPTPLTLDPSDLFRAPVKGLAFDELVSVPMSIREPAPSEPHSEIPLVVIPRYLAPSVKFVATALPGKRIEAPQEPDFDRGGISFRSAERVIGVEYQDGGTEGLVNIRQVNHASDQDVVTSDDIVNADGSLVLPPELHVEETFAGLVKQAQAAVPAAVPAFIAADTQEVIAAVADRDRSWHETGSPHVDSSPVAAAPDGRSVDGKVTAETPHEPSLTDIAPWRPEEPAKTASEAEGTITGPRPTEDVATIAETGLNQLTNAAGIVDLNEAVGSMMVGGDYFFSRGIVQVNLLVDNDHVDVAVAGALNPVIRTQGNEVHNIAEFVTHESTASVRGAAGMSFWSVDVVSGDFYDIKSITQINDLNDNDRVVQAEAGTYFDLRTGENQQINLSKVYGLDDYDLIVIRGDYHRANWIYQYNIVLDSDLVKMLTTGGEDDSTTVSTGFNQLKNIAEIETYDSTAFKPMLGAHRDLMTMLDEGATILKPNAEWNLYGNPSGTLKVLYVSGDYYDVNVITQVNMLVDMDQTIQASAASGSTQGVASGGNIALNEAHIIDPGRLSTSNYLGGESYEESVLIQVNMITDTDTVTIHDTQSLVPELVAFAEQATMEREIEDIRPQWLDPAQHDHLMSNMLC